MSAKNDTIYRDVGARFHYDRVADLNVVGGYFHHLEIAANRNSAGDKIEKVANGPSAAPDRQPLQNFGGEYEASDDQGCEKLTDG